jgi:hypothetical protein
MFNIYIYYESSSDSKAVSYAKTISQNTHSFCEREGTNKLFRVYAVSVWRLNCEGKGKTCMVISVLEKQRQNIKKINSICISPKQRCIEIPLARSNLANVIKRRSKTHSSSNHHGNLHQKKFFSCIC